MSIEKSGQHQIKSNQWISKNNNNNNKTLSLKDLIKKNNSTIFICRHDENLHNNTALNQ